MNSRVYKSPEADLLFKRFRGSGTDRSLVCEAGYFDDVPDGNPYKYYAAVFTEQAYKALLEASHNQQIANFREASHHVSPLDIPCGPPAQPEYLPWEDLIDSGLLVQDATAQLAISSAVSLARTRFMGVPTVDQLMPAGPTH